MNPPEFNPREIRNDVEIWLERLQEGLELGRFAFCEEGNLTPTKGPNGVMPVVFAAKIAWQIGLWDRWPSQLKENISDFIYNAQLEDGSYVDQWLRSQTKASWKDWAKILLRRNHLRQTLDYYSHARKAQIRAETRQNIATLLMLEKLPKYCPPCEVSNYDETEAFLSSLDWSHPWAAGSHLSHQLMLTETSERMGSERVNANEVKQAVFDFLNTIYDEKSGCWYKGANVTNALKINGAMKVFSGLQWVESPFNEHNNLLDTVLAEPFHSDGCHFLNSLFVIYQVIRLQGNDYRKTEVIERVRMAARKIMHNKKHKSGFSFFENRSQNEYYRARSSKGLNIADLHGTMMFIWASAIIVKILADDYPEEAQIWQVHMP